MLPLPDLWIKILTVLVAFAACQATRLFALWGYNQDVEPGSGLDMAITATVVIGIGIGADLASP